MLRTSAKNLKADDGGYQEETLPRQGGSSHHINGIASGRCRAQEVGLASQPMVTG